MIVFFNAKTITCISEMLVRIFEEYEYEYENVKKSIDISDKNLDVIWSPVWVEPYHSDFILEIDDNTAPIRKKWKRNKLLLPPQYRKKLQPRSRQVIMLS